MATVNIYNATGEKAGTMELPDAVFAVKPKSSVIHQVYNALLANRREPWADTKKRGEVRGGGKKPWQQKGTGRARHGSIRSPIWKGGGVTFGPLSVRSYKQKINKKMSQVAMKMTLSDKVKQETLLVVDDVPRTGKTKDFMTMWKRLPGFGKSTLLLTSVKDESLQRAVNNIETVALCQAKDVNVVDLLHHQTVVATKDAIESLQKRFVK